VETMGKNCLVQLRDNHDVLTDKLFFFFFFLQFVLQNKPNPPSALVWAFSGF
jgi:hypothetical protein